LKKELKEKKIGKNKNKYGEKKQKKKLSSKRNIQEKYKKNLIELTH